MIYTTLDTFYLTDEQLANSPSRKDKIDEKTETALRIYGCELVQEGCILLRLPQAVAATGQVILHRFYCKKSFAKFNVKRVAASCVWLAAKLEEALSPRRTKDVLNVFHRIEQRREGLVPEHLDYYSKKYDEFKIDLIRTERHILKEMGFICHVEHPHKFILLYLQNLDASRELMQEAWSLANDSLRTTLCVRFKSETVACGVIYAAARRLRYPLPDDPPWQEAFAVKQENIDKVVRALAYLYRQPKAKYIEVVKENRSFVLSSRAWSPPPAIQELRETAKPASGSEGSMAGAAILPPPPPDGPGPGSSSREEAPTSERPLETAQGANEEKKSGSSEEPNKRPVEGPSRDRDRSRDGSRDAERSGGADRAVSRVREADRERERSRERGRESRDARERGGRDYVERVGDRDRRPDKHRPPSGRDRDGRPLYVSREKDKGHRHHPYERPGYKR